MKKAASIFIIICLVIGLACGAVLYFRLNTAMNEAKELVNTLTEQIEAKDSEIAALSDANTELETDVANLRTQMDIYLDNPVFDAEELAQVEEGRFNNTKRLILSLQKSGKYPYEFHIQEEPFDEDIVAIHVTGTSDYGKNLDYTMTVSFTENSNKVHFEIFRLLNFYSNGYREAFSSCNDINTHWDWVTVYVDPHVPSISVSHDEVVTNTEKEGDHLLYVAEQIIANVAQFYDSFSW